MGFNLEETGFELSNSRFQLIALQFCHGSFFKMIHFIEPECMCQSFLADQHFEWIFCGCFEIFINFCFFVGLGEGGL